MVQLPEPFDPTQVRPSQGGAGKFPVSDAKGHLVQIVADEMKTTIDQQGAYLELTLEAMEGAIAGETMPYRLNLVNSSADAVRIAYEQFSAVCHVCGHLQRIDDAVVLHRKPFRVVVVADKDPEKAAKGFVRISHVLYGDGRAIGSSQPSASPSPAHQQPINSPAPPAPAPAPAPVQTGFPEAPEPVPAAAGNAAKPPWQT